MNSSSSSLSSSSTTPPPLPLPSSLSSTSTSSSSSSSSSSSIKIARANGDTSFIITISSNRYLVDPWLLGHEIDCCSFFNKQYLVEATIDIDNIGVIDAIIITHEFSDHLHEETLLLLDATIPILATKSAIGRLKQNKVLSKRNMIEIPASNKGVQILDYNNTGIGIISATGAFDYVHNALLIVPKTSANEINESDILLCDKDNGTIDADTNTARGGVVYSPHGFFLNKRDAILKDLESYKIDVLIITMTEYYLPFYVGGTVNLGIQHAANVVDFLKPKVVINCHSEKKRASGIIPLLAKPIYPSIEEIKEKIPNYFDLKRTDEYSIVG